MSFFVAYGKKQLIKNLNSFYFGCFSLPFARELGKIDRRELWIFDEIFLSPLTVLLSAGKVMARHRSTDAGCQEGDSLLVPLWLGSLALGYAFHQSAESQGGAHHNQQRVEGNQREEGERRESYIAIGKLFAHSHVYCFFQFRFQSKILFFPEGTRNQSGRWRSSSSSSSEQDQSNVYK